MSIIPHNPINVQVSILKKTDQNQTFLKTNHFHTYGLSATQREAYHLYDLGFNVLPQPIASKGGLPWKRLQYERLNRDDESYGLRHLFAGRCNLAIMCGATSGNLFVIDCESHDSFLYHLQQMRNHNIPIWAATSARGGHIYLRASNGEVHNIEPDILPDTEIKGRNGYVLAPPSVHPDGTMYQWLVQEGDSPPIIDTNNIDWLHTRYGEKVQLKFNAPSNSTKGDWSMHIISPTSNLCRETRDYLENGNRLAEGTRNNRLFKAACDLCGNEYSQSEAEHILLPIAAMSGLPMLEIKATINSAYSKQRNPSRPNNKVVSLRHWRYALIWGIQHQWQSRTASSNRALFLALVERARVSANENGVFRASIRELSELAKLGTTTVQNALSRLQEINIIHNCGHDHNSKASLWRFRDEIMNVTKQLELNMNTVSIPPHWLRYSESVFNSNIVERGALGHSVNFVYQFLRTIHQPMMPLDIAESLGMSVNQVNYALRKLSQYDLIQRFDEGWYPVVMTQSELEATFEHVAGKSEARAARYQQERQIFAGYILFNARIRREGRAYMDVISHQFDLKREAQAILDDPLLELGIELGAVLRYSDEKVH